MKEERRKKERKKERKEERKKGTKKERKKERRKKEKKETLISPLSGSGCRQSFSKVFICTLVENHTDSNGAG